jgi:hypothetical protein
MKKLLLATALLTSLSATAKKPIDGKIEHIKNMEAAQAVAELVEAYGYRCDSISSFLPFVFGRGYTLRCNGLRYTYELTDRGGRWVVKVK